MYLFLLIHLETIENKRVNSDEFGLLWKELIKFLENYNVSMEVERTISNKRKLAQNVQYKDYFIESTIGSSDIYEDSVNTSDSQAFWKTHFYNQVMDNIIGDLKSRFTPEVYYQ